MVRYQVRSDYGTVYSEALNSAGISHLLEIKYDTELEMWIANIDVPDTKHKEASQVMATARQLLAGF